tara:strand:- start:180 stop:620 length:441 start_codon:yes stop_codon:yes gene_type:complete
MYIKAKYPKVGNEFGGPNAGPQGFGSLYGGNQTSNVIELDTRASNGSVGSVSTSQMFGGNVISIYNNTNSGIQLIFTNDSAFIVSDSDGVVTEIDTLRALEFINDSNFVYVDPVVTILLDALQARATYFENTDGSRILLETFKNCE